MRETRKIATLIVKRYKMEDTLIASEKRTLDKWKSRSDENEDILNKLIEIFNEKENPPFFVHLLTFQYSL